MVLFNYNYLFLIKKIKVIHNNFNNKYCSI